jgi:hypothetical protein
MRQLIVTASFLIISFLVSGCEQREFNSAISTPTAVDISIPTLTPTVVTTNPQSSPTSSFTLTPISTNSPSVTATNSSLVMPMPLSEAILISSEVNDYSSSLMGYFGETTDVTDELLAGNNCLVDCVKHVWSAGQYGPRRLIITLIKSSSPTKAERLVEDTRKTFIDIDDLSDRSSLSSLPKNAWSIYYYPRQEFVLNYSYGEVFVLIVSQPNEGFDDFAGEFDLISLISRLQMEKLNKSGYIP